MDTDMLLEPAREIPVIGDYDLCVLGGSCTGVFAAVRAARLGLSVGIVERMGCFGGVATLSMVNIWHTDLDEVHERQIFAGLSLELMDRLKARNAVTEKPNNPSSKWIFNSAEMQIELDALVTENRIAPWLHTSFCAPYVEDGKLTAIVVENKSGRGAIKSRYFIDATGDGDLCQRLGLQTYLGERRQPSTTCALFSNWSEVLDKNLQAWVREYREAYDLPEGFVWGAKVPGSDLKMMAGTRVYENCSDGRGLTRAEIEGRRQVRAIHDILRSQLPDAPPVLQALPAKLGIRETRHVRCLHRLTGEEVLLGKRFEDAIANGSYRVDIHHSDKPGLTFRYLDGREVYSRPGHPHELSRWRPVTGENPTFYQIPYRSLIPAGPFGNVLAAGRFIDADEQAHAAIRVMVNMNQTGEAAGVAVALAHADNLALSEVAPDKLRRSLADGGSIIL